MPIFSTKIQTFVRQFYRKFFLKKSSFLFKYCFSFLLFSPHFARWEFSLRCCVLNAASLSPQASMTKFLMFWNMGKQTRRKKSSKELRHEAQQIEIIVTQDNDDDQNAQEVIPEIRVLHNTSKNLAFDDADEYIVGNDVFSEVHKWLKPSWPRRPLETIYFCTTKMQRSSVTCNIYFENSARFWGHRGQLRLWG